jgi:hypothetical protein
MKYKEKKISVITVAANHLKAGEETSSERHVDSGHVQHNLHTHNSELASRSGKSLKSLLRCRKRNNDSKENTKERSKGNNMKRIKETINDMFPSSLTSNALVRVQ